LFLVLGLVLPFALASAPVRKSLPTDYRTQFQPEEGYLQGWNFSFSNEDFKIIVTFLVSNFGPGKLNNGISMILKKGNEPTYYSTREFDSDDYVTKKDQFFQQSGENWMDFRDGKFILHAVFPEWTVDLEYTPDSSGGVAISGGKKLLGDGGRFVQADIPFSFSQVKGTLLHKGAVIPIQGVGGMEHLLTNYEVYKYSKKWEIARGESKSGERVFVGGFLGNERFPGGFYKKVAVLSKSGELLFEGTVQSVQVLETEEDKISGYTLSKKEVLQFVDKESCQLEIQKGKLVSGMSALENISALLRFFIGLFFAKPYQLHHEVEFTWNCGKLPTKSKVIFSSYLINE